MRDVSSGASVGEAHAPMARADFPLPPAACRASDAAAK